MKVVTGLFFMFAQTFPISIRHGLEGHGRFGCCNETHRDHSRGVTCSAFFIKWVGLTCASGQSFSFAVFMSRVVLFGDLTPPWNGWLRYLNRSPKDGFAVRYRFTQSGK